MLSSRRGGGSGSRGRGLPVGAARAHEHQRTLSKGRVDQKRHGGQRQPEVDVMEQQERREGPQHVEEQEKRPDGEEFLADRGRSKKHGAEHKGAHGDKDGGGGNEKTKDEGGVGQGRQKIPDFS